MTVLCILFVTECSSSSQKFIWTKDKKGKVPIVNIPLSQLCDPRVRCSSPFPIALSQQWVSCRHSPVMWAVGYTSPTYCRYLSNPSLMDYYSFNRPRRDGWLRWSCWLTDSRCFTHKVVTRPAVSLAQDRESLPARTGGLTTMLCHQLD